MSKQKLHRAYNGSDVEMLTACETIINSAIEHKKILLTKRSTWADPFFSDIQTRIQNAFTQFLGMDNAKDLRAATQKVQSLQTEAVKQLAEFKTQLQEDFKKDKPRLNELLSLLGFTSFHKAAQKGNQEALIQHLFQFKTNMLPELLTEITEKGIALETVHAISTQADTLRESDITQESLKGNRKEITRTAVTEFNEIYEQVISVAKIAAKFFKGNKAVQEQFSYHKIRKNLK